MELKFRVWHKKYKGYYELDAINFYDKYVSYILNDYVNQEQSLEYFDFDEVIIEQYTGMKDKNGIEIYVGDIVKYTHDWEVYAVENEIAVVEFEEGGFSPMQLANGGTYYALEGKPIYEVIGNIHDREERLNV